MEVLVFFTGFFLLILIIGFFASLASDSKHARAKAEAARKSNARVASIPSYGTSSSYAYTSEDWQKRAGDHGEALVAAELDRLKVNGTILDYVQTENMAHGQSRFEVDFVVYTKDKGLFLLETKYWAGTLTVKPEGEWYQTRNGYPGKALKNPVAQVNRQQRMLRAAIADTGLPVPATTPAVVMAHDQCSLKVQGAQRALDVELLHVKSLSFWLNTKPEVHCPMSRHQWVMLKALITELEQDAVVLERWMEQQSNSRKCA